MVRVDLIVSGRRERDVWFLGGGRWRLEIVKGGILVWILGDGWRVEVVELDDVMEVLRVDRWGVVYVRVGMGDCEEFGRDVE